MGKVLVDGEAKVKGATFVHAFIRFDSQRKVKNVVRVREVGAHSTTEGKL